MDSSGEDYEEMKRNTAENQLSMPAKMNTKLPAPISVANPSKVVSQKPPQRSKAGTAADSRVSPRVGPKPKKRAGMDELKSKAKEKFRHFKSAPDSNNIHMYIPEEATQYIEIDDKKGELTVQEFANRFSEQLPMQVYVSKGTYGMEDKYSLSTDDICNIHFMRHRELIEVEDKERQLNLFIPLNSAIKFGIVYNPQDNENEAMKGYLFPNVSDLLSLGYSSLPKIVCACQFHDPERPGSEPTREVMAIKEIILPDNPDEFRKLRVYSITALKERILDENVYGHFSTRPSFMQLYLPEILKYVSKSIPSQVSMFRNPLKNVAPGVPSSLFRKIIHMKRQFTSAVLIATNMLDQGLMKAAQPFEIPMDIDIEFQVIKLPDEKMKQIQEDTRYFAENMDESDIKHYRYVNVSDEVHRLQCSVFMAIRGRGQSEEDPDYLHPITGNRLSVEKRVDLAEKGLKKVNIGIENLKLDIERHDGQNDYIKSWCHAIEEKFMKQLEDVREEIAVLRSEITAARPSTIESACVPEQDDKDTILTSQTETEILRNKQLLSQMDVQQVGLLLKSAGLEAYIEVFKGECISGDILQEVDDSVLSKELGVKSKLHRIRMMRLISGKFPHGTYAYATGNV